MKNIEHFSRRGHREKIAEDAEVNLAFLCVLHRDSSSLLISA
jgi:hypothetical protein